uniref:Uncharacterized protein n=1 Tax=Podarcis muralis TaxID=64176 RepID=A0A670HR97_PODMU
MPSPLYLRLPDEARSIPPPRLFNRGSVYLGFLGWISVLLENAIRQRPVSHAICTCCHATPPYRM